MISQGTPYHIYIQIHVYVHELVVKNTKIISVGKNVPFSCSSDTKLHTSCRCEHEARAGLFFNFHKSKTNS